MCHRKEKDKNEFQGLDILKEETVAASSDLTGLVQKPPSDEAEMESYAELHHVPVAEDIPERQK